VQDSINLKNLIDQNFADSGDAPGLSDYQEYLLAEQLQHKIDGLKGEISNFETK
jgi:hypothetical protein